MKRMKREATVAGVIGAGLIYAMAASADPYNPGERALGGGLLGTGTGAVTGAIAGGGHGAGIGAAVGGGLGAVAGAATMPTTPPRPSTVAITAASIILTLLVIKRRLEIRRSDPQSVNPASR